MKHAWQAGIVVTAFVLALAGASCVSSNQIDSSTGLVEMNVSASSTPTGYPWATMKIAQMKFHPVTPGALDNPFALLPTATTIDLNSPASSVPPVQATAQAYALDPFDVTFQLNIVDVAPTSRTCDGSTLVSLVTDETSERSTVAPTCQFTVQRNATATIAVVVDGAGLVALLESKFDCATSVYTPPTSAELLPLLQFQCGP